MHKARNHGTGKVQGYVMNALIKKSEFIGLDNTTWLYSGAETPSHKGSVAAVQDYLRSRSLGPIGRDRNMSVEKNCKEQLALLMNGKAEDIAFLSNSSEGISMIAASLDWKSGDNVIINTLEFPSGVLPWLKLREKGVDIRLIEDHDGEVSVESILQAADERTRLVMTSHVSYLTGARLNYRALYQELKKTNILLLLDVTQSLGVIPVDMYEADFVVCSSYKWLLSTHGAAVLAVNRQRIDLRPAYVGWRSVQDMFGSERFQSFELQQDARRFELGYPSYPTLYSMNFTVQLLRQVGIPRIEEHVLGLGTYLIGELTKLGFNVMTPAEPQKRAGNISVRHEQGEVIAEKLLKEQVYIWGGDGRFRISLHLFNDLEDVERLLKLLPSTL
ncbi:aminotransferase class V-fold PLP-dependent enzyme [Paenibacillus senegalensis]|uniref:aminotransferase class V-fold PLP-dependent enzyme n=1 Tax=Paenibacillus senegalensis TaxID=1465766 RepID=UPI000289BDFD|nr:aminotransferase class V-fold PLP-dependent enzyme [Paenibacillus senegalensis]